MKNPIYLSTPEFPSSCGSICLPRTEDSKVSYFKTKNKVKHGDTWFYFQNSEVEVGEIPVSLCYLKHGFLNLPQAISQVPLMT